MLNPVVAILMGSKSDLQKIDSAIVLCGPGETRHNVRRPVG